MGNSFDLTNGKLKREEKEDVLPPELDKCRPIRMHCDILPALRPYNRLSPLKQ